MCKPHSNVQTLDAAGNAVEPMYTSPSTQSQLSETPSSHFSAQLSCNFCRKRKRKCDKRLPECSFCIRNKRKCQFPSRRMSFPVRENTSPSISINHRNSQTEAIRIYFLDQEIFHQAHMQLPSIASEIPEYVANLLGDLESVLETAMQYFSTIHLWWSIISKKIFYNSIVNPLLPRCGDSTLLLLCMKLIVWKPSTLEPDPRTPLYLAAKRYFMELETASGLSIRMLQSNVLISLYEIGHGIYPSALLTISVCARYGKALKISLGVHNESAMPINWLDEEERRRIWWAILILDRFSDINVRQRSLEAESPSPQDLLPADDSSWDNGVAPSDDRMTISSPSTVKMGRFAKLAQATHLLCRVLEHVSDVSMDPQFRETQARQLEKAIHASIRMFTGALKGTGGAHAMICYSALFVLHAGALSMEVSTPKDVERRGHAQDVLERASKTGATASSHYLEGHALPTDQVSALVLHWLYQAAAFYIHMSKKSIDTNYKEDLEKLKLGLTSLDSRWKVAGIYLRMLDAREVMQIN